MGFFQRDPVTFAFERRMYRVHFYDCNEGSNVIAICRRFLNGLQHEADIYSNALHPFYNECGRCGHLTFLELYLCFHQGTNPFRRRLVTRSLIGNRDDGHHGPLMWEPRLDRSHRLRNRNIPRHQMRRGR